MYNANVPACIACEPGWFQQSTGKTYCVGCYPGFYTEEFATVRCKKCPTGSVALGRWATECQTCQPWQTAGRQICHPSMFFAVVC